MTAVEMFAESLRLRHKEAYNDLYEDIEAYYKKIEKQQMSMQLNTKVYTMGGDRRHVKETVEEIQKKIKETENITTVTWKTGTTPHI